MFLRRSRSKCNFEDHFTKERDLGFIRKIFCFSSFLIGPRAKCLV